MILNKSLIKRIFGFAIVGGMGTILNAALLYVFTEYVGIFYVLSSIIATEIAIIHNFILNDHFVFGKKFHSMSRTKRFVTFQMGMIFGASLSVVLLAIFTEIFGIYYMYSYVLSVIIVFMVNFTTSSKFAWKKDEDID